jgi:crotonobetainyl-CoA:carnitine CoA-transferase CaiB-like acyl-CoA transferase
MEILGPPTFGQSGDRPAFALGVDTASIVTKVASIKEARALPLGTLVGDMHGGLTFTDAVAAALEARSYRGWQEMQTPSGETWTIILLNR